MWPSQGQHEDSRDSSPSKDSMSVSASYSPPSNYAASTAICALSEEASSVSAQGGNWPKPPIASPTVNLGRRSVSKRNPMEDSTGEIRGRDWEVHTGASAVKQATLLVKVVVRYEVLCLCRHFSSH